MKRVPVAVAILLLFLCVATLGIVYAKSTCTTMSEYAKTAQQYCEENNAADAAETINRMSAYFESRHPVLSLYARHDELETLDTNLVVVTEQVAVENLSLAAVTLSEINFMVNHIYERELPGFHNLF